MTVASNQKILFKAACHARKNAHSPYSGFQVGAAVETESGEIFSGCNVENASYGLTLCAERNAVFTGIANGFKTFTRLLLVTDTERPVTPCGACRQVLAEFNLDLEIIMTTTEGDTIVKSLAELLPDAFEFKKE